MGLRSNNKLHFSLPSWKFFKSWNQVDGDQNASFITRHPELDHFPVGQPWGVMDKCKVETKQSLLQGGIAQPGRQSKRVEISILFLFPFTRQRSEWGSIERSSVTLIDTKSTWKFAIQERRFPTTTLSLRIPVNMFISLHLCQQWVAVNTFKVCLLIGLKMLRCCGDFFQLQWPGPHFRSFWFSWFGVSLICVFTSIQNLHSW